MARGADLTSQARGFGILLKELLNQTICDGAHVSVVIVRSEPGRVIVGTSLDGLIASPVPVRIDRKKAKVQIEAQYRCFLDPLQYLTVFSSYCAVSAADGTRLCHYDYEREKALYPPAHFQVDGHSPALDRMPGPRNSAELAKLHFPVGGRRYRPCIEDIIEFLIVEKLAAGRRGWQAILDRERQRFLDIQLKAAIRHQPDLARGVLAEIDRK